MVSQNGTQFSQACFYPTACGINGNLAFDKAQICQLCPRPQVALITEDGISQVGKMSCLGPVQENGVLNLGYMSYHAIFTNQAFPPDIGAMAHFGLIADYGRRFD